MCNLRSGSAVASGKCRWSILVWRAGRLVWCRTDKIIWIVSQRRECGFSIRRGKQRLQPTGSELRAQLAKIFFLPLAWARSPRELNLHVFSGAARNGRSKTDSTSVLWPSPYYAPWFVGSLIGLLRLAEVVALKLVTLMCPQE